MSYFLRERDEYGEMGTYSFAKVLYKSRNLCGNFCKAKSPTHSAVCIYALTEFSVPLFSNTHNPLAIITTSLALVRKRLSNGDRNKEHLNIIEEEIGRIARIMRQLLDSSRPSSDIGLLQVNEVIQQLMKFVEGELAARQIKSRLELANDLPVIRMSLDQLKQVLLNLIKNAQDAMPQGGTLLCKTTSQAGGLSISVADTGSGIPPEHLRRVFEPFFTTKKHSEGMGLGLSVSANIVKSSGGMIEVDSAPGKGTVFRVCFPAYRPSREENHFLARGYVEVKEEEEHDGEDTHY